MSAFMSNGAAISMISCLCRSLILMGLTAACQVVSGNEDQQLSDFEQEQQYYQEELSRLKVTDASNRDHVYFVKLAGGYIPIPDRFVFYPDAKKLDQSVYATLFAGAHIAPSSLTRGSIDIGQYELYLNNTGLRYKKKFNMEEKCYGKLCVVIMTEKLSENSWLKPIKMILFHDEYNYMLMVNQNSDLWEAMLISYKNTVDRENEMRPLISSVADSDAAERARAESEAKAEYPKQEYYKNELREIENPTSDNAKHVFFIKLADGYLPIPNRFIINPNVKSEDPSVAVTLVSSGLGDMTLGAEGTISIGDFKVYKKLWDERKSRPEYFDSEEQQHGKLKVIRMIEQLRSPAAPPVEITVFHDDKHYVFLHDRNRHLWKSMIKGYENTVIEAKRIKKSYENQQ